MIRDIRGRGRTVLLTTHYMDEAERLCDRVAVVDHGRLIAMGPPADLIARLGGDHVVEFAINGGTGGPGGAAAGADAAPGRVPGEERLLALPAVRAARIEADGIALTVTEPHVAIPALLELLRSEGVALARLTTRHVSLEDVFVSLTGRHLRDDDGASA